MKKLLIVFCMILIGALVLSTWIFIRQSEKVYDEDTTLPFEDIEKDAWYYDYLTEAYDRGWIKGLSVTCFDPDASIQRGDLSVFGRAGCSGPAQSL